MNKPKQNSNLLQIPVVNSIINQIAKHYPIIELCRNIQNQISTHHRALLHSCALLCRVRLPCASSSTSPTHLHKLCLKKRLMKTHFSKPNHEFLTAKERKKTRAVVFNLVSSADRRRATRRRDFRQFVPTSQSLFKQYKICVPFVWH